MNFEEKLDFYLYVGVNFVRKYEAIAASFSHGQRDSSNTLQLIEALETLDGEDCIGAAMVAFITTDNKSMSRLPSTNYPMTLSTKDELAFKNKDLCWVCKKKLSRVVGI